MRWVGRLVSSGRESRLGGELLAVIWRGVGAVPRLAADVGYLTPVCVRVSVRPLTSLEPCGVYQIRVSRCRGASTAPAQSGGALISSAGGANMAASV